jgi:hypothetical protein
VDFFHGYFSDDEVTLKVFDKLTLSHSESQQTPEDYAEAYLEWSHHLLRNPCPGAVQWRLSVCYHAYINI